MKRSEFDEALKTVYGEAFGASLCQDLYLTAFRASPAQALAQNEDPQAVWNALLEETGKSKELRYIHRLDRRGRQQHLGGGML